MNRIISISLAILVTTSCQENEPKHVQASLDLSTPEKTVRTYVREMSRQMRLVFRNLAPDTLFAEKAKLSVRHRLDSLDKSFDSFDLSFTVKEISHINQDRAIVVTSQLALLAESEPGEMRYVLQRSGSVWLIEDILKKCAVCSGSGKTTDFERRLADINRGRYNTEPKKKCEYCNGTGTASVLLGF